MTNLKEIENLRKEFIKIVKKYNLDEESKATEISKLLTNNKEKDKIDSKELKQILGFEEEKEAAIFLKFIDLGIKFKKNTIN
jgi:DNA integrity scanning protein DisA with diadenylate cyclase activity